MARSGRAVLYISDGAVEGAAMARTTHMAISAHQDDIEFMAYAPIVACFGQADKWFSGVVVTDGAGSPRSGLYADYTDEEMKMQNEGRKILHLPELRVTCTCVRVPVMRSHSIAVTVRTKEKITVAEANEAIRAFPGCRLIEDYEGRCYPTPLDTSGQDLVWVGRVREDLTQENALTLWCCGDQIRKGAASNAVQILKYLL